MQSEFYSHGKLLITGEYTILKGATGLALPTKRGQKMLVKSSSTLNNHKISWKAFDSENKLWFESEISYANWEILSTNNPTFSLNLILVLKEANLKSNFFTNKSEDFLVETFLEFPNNWGLGSSSTFINNIARWLGVNPFELLFNTFGGSGYDIACAFNSTPIFYSLENAKPIFSTVNFLPEFHKNIFFVHLNKKKETSSALSNFLKNSTVNQVQINRITEITQLLVKSETIQDFSDLLMEHETILASILKEKTIKEQLFPDYPHAIKSLGAWGGDFILIVTNTKADLSYFINKNYQTILAYQEMIL